MANRLANRTRPFAVTGAALASAAAVVLATPDLVSTRDLSIASAPSPTKLSSANYDLTAFSDITVQGINDAYWFGWGGYVGCGTVNSEGACTYTPQDTYYPGVNQVYANALTGVLYYLVDNAIDQFNDDFDLDNYFFEIGWLNDGNPNSNYSGIGSLFYVGIGELFGTDSQIFQTAQTILYYGVTNVINSTIVNLVTALVPEIELGPITVGGGILASLYYFAQTPVGASVDFSYSTNGLPAIWAYISTALTGLVPTAAATPEAAGATPLAAGAAETVETAKAALAGSKTEDAAATTDAGTTDAGTTESVTEGTPAVDAAVTDTTTAPATVTEAAATEATAAEATGAETTGAATTGAAATDAGASGTSAESATTATESTGASTTAKTPKPKAQSPLGKVTNKIRSALGGGENTGGKHRADGTGRSSSAASSSAASSSASSSSESSDAGSSSSDSSN